jgi:hypothetical protein
MVFCDILFITNSDTTNSSQFHPTLPFVATTSGQRKFQLSEEYSDDVETHQADTRLLVWQLHQNWITADTRNTS